MSPNNKKLVYRIKRGMTEGGGSYARLYQVCLNVGFSHKETQELLCDLVSCFRTKEDMDKEAAK